MKALRWMVVALLLASGALAHGQATVAVIMLSDLHFDPLHDPGKAARLAAAPVSEWDAILKEPATEHAAEDFAAAQTACGARGADSDFDVLTDSLRAAREHAGGAAFVTVTGDLLVHVFECKYDLAMHEKHATGYAEFAEKTAVYVIQHVEAAFPGLPVYVAGGNNDSSCGDYAMNADDRYFAATSAAVMSGLRGASADEKRRAAADYAAGGNFAVTLKAPRRTRLLVLDDIFLSARYKTCAGKKDEAAANAELMWLDRELTEAKAHGEVAWVMGHVPPGVDSYATATNGGDLCTTGKVTEFLASDRLAQVLEKHADGVRLALFGHTHTDEIRLLAGAGGRVPMKLVASISPVNGNRPTFTLAQVDAKTATLKDYTVFMASNSTGDDTIWAKEYSYRETYHEPDFSAASVADLVGQLQADAAGEQPVSHAYETYFTPGMLPVLSLIWKQYGCAMGHTGEAEYKSCVCQGKN